jgi:hypothetical protein
MTSVQLLEPLLIGIVVALLFIGATFSRAIASRVNVEPLEAQRPWDRYLNFVGLLWMISLMAFNFLQNTGRLSHPYLVATGVAVITLIGLTTVWVQYRRVLVMDEFIRRIRTEAIALGFGLSLVGVVALALLESSGIREEIGFHEWGLVVMYAVGTASIIVYMRYR